MLHIKKFKNERWKQAEINESKYFKWKHNHTEQMEKKSH